MAAQHREREQCEPGLADQRDERPQHAEQIGSAAALHHRRSDDDQKRPSEQPGWWSAACEQRHHDGEHEWYTGHDGADHRWFGVLHRRQHGEVVAAEPSRRGRGQPPPLASAWMAHEPATTAAGHDHEHERGQPVAHGLGREQGIVGQEAACCDRPADHRHRGRGLGQRNRARSGISERGNDGGMFVHRLKVRAQWSCEQSQ